MEISSGILAHSLYVYYLIYLWNDIKMPSYNSKHLHGFMNQIDVKSILQIQNYINQIENCINLIL